MKNTQDRNDKMFDIILGEAFEKYAHDVANEELEYELSDEEMAELESKKQEIYNRIMKDINKESKKKFPVKRIIVLAAVLIVVITTCVMGFTVSGFRSFFYQTITDVKGTILNINSEKVVEESYNNIRNFENKSEIIIPGWLPPDMVLDTISDDTASLELYYNNDNVWLTIKEEVLSYNTNTRVNTENNRFLLKNLIVLGMESNIVEITSETDNKIYMANFCSNNVDYTLMTNGSEIMFETILKNLEYFEE